MKIDYISDVHLDFYVKLKNLSKTEKQLKLLINKILPDEPSEVLIIAGDLSHYNHLTIKFLTLLKEIYKEIYFVLGNHDMYLVSGSQKKIYGNSISRIIDLEDRVKELEDVFLLRGEVKNILGTDIKIGGCMGWYQIHGFIDVERWRQVSNDSRMIYISNYKFQQNYWLENYEKDQAQKLKDIAEEGCDILVTHVPQIPWNSEHGNSKYIGSPDNIFYWNNRFNLIKDINPKVYVFGHTHDNYNFKLNDIEFKCNPLGYPGETLNKIETFEI